MKGFAICPKCGQRLSFELDEKSLSNAGGLIPITIIHGYPDAHALVVYVDQTGANRGYEIIENLVDLRTSFSPKEATKILGVKRVAKILAGIVGEFNLFIKADHETLKLLHILLSQIMKNEFFRIVSNERFADYVIDFLTKKKVYVPGEKYFRKIINKALEYSDNGFADMLSVQVNRTRMKISELINMLEKREYTEKEIKEILELDDEEFKIALEYIKAKKPVLVNRIIRTALDIF